MRRRLGLGAVGLMLLVPAAVYWTWIWIYDPVRPEDGRTAFKRLVTIPIGEAARNEGGVDVSVATPNDTSWLRIIHNWGDPGYIIGAVSAKLSHRMYCLKSLDVRVQAMVGDSPVSLETAEYAPYDYSIDCEPAGLKFRVTPGTVVKIHLTVRRNPPPDLDLIVEPYWTVGTKDHLVGISLQEDLPATTNALGAAGIVAIAFAMWKRNDPTRDKAI